MFMRSAGARADESLAPRGAAVVHRDERCMHRVTPLPRRALPEDSRPYVVDPDREDHSGREPRSSGAELDQRMCDALTDLAAYALNLDIEYDRLDKRVGKLTEEACSGEDLSALLRERAELAEERDEFRGAIAAFREQLTRQ